MQLVVRLYECLALLILLLIVVPRVTEVVVPIDSLVELGRFLEVSCLEELPSDTFEVDNTSQLALNWELVEVDVLRQGDHSNDDRDFVSILKEFVLIEDVIGEVGPEFVSASRLELDYGPPLHRL